MDKSSTFTSMGNYIRANRHFFLILLLLVVTVGGYFWWRSGSSLEIGRFFAAGLEGSISGASVNGASATVTNNSNAERTVHLAAWCAVDGPPGLDTQWRHGVVRATVAIGESANLSIAGCGCWTQYDLSGNPNPPANASEYGTSGGPGLLDYAFGQGALCGPKPTPRPTRSATPSPTASVSATPEPGDGNLEGVCAGGATPQITLTWPVQPPAGAPGPINEGNPAVINKTTGTQPAVQLDPPATVSGTDWVWADTDVQSGETYTYRAKYGANADTTTVTITASPENCGAPPETSQPPPETSQPPSVPLTCAPASQNADVGESVAFSATGGAGGYDWYAPGGTPAGDSGTPFSVSYDVPGSKTVVVSSGGNQVACTVLVNAAAESSPPPSGELVCTPQNQNAISGQDVQIAGSGGTRPYSWTAPDGSPASGGDTTPFIVSFVNTTASASTFPVTLQDSTSEASVVCNVTVSCAPPVCDAPEGCSYEGGNACACGTLACPSGAPLVCTPPERTMNRNQQREWTAGGGTPPYAWTAPGSTTASASGTALTTGYGSTGDYTITVRDSLNATALCEVTVRSGGGGGGSSSPDLAVVKTVRNVTVNGPEGNSTNASPGNTVEFFVRVTAGGNRTATQVIVRDTLPAGLSYVAGSTMIDNAPAADGITGGGLNLGDMDSGRTITVKFRAAVAADAFFSAGTTSLTNVAFARASNAPESSDTAYVSVARAAANSAVTLTKAGRNVTRNETGERALVQASPNNELEFFLRIRNTSAFPLANVIVRDALPSQVSYVAGTARLNGSPIADTLATSGVNIGTLAVGAEALVTFRGRVGPASQFSPGNTNLVNTAYTRADGIPELMAQLPIVVQLTVGPVTEIETGPGDSAMLALAISAIVTLLYVGYTGTNVYRRREVTGLAKDSHSDHDLFNFRR